LPGGGEEHFKTLNLNKFLLDFTKKNENWPLNKNVGPLKYQEKFYKKTFFDYDQNTRAPVFSALKSL